MSDRYWTPGVEGHFEPGSDGRVLANKLGITRPEEMDDLETQLLQELYQRILWWDFPDRRLSVTDLKTWHRWWLGNVYEWAGEERTVNLSKGGFPFAASARVASLLQDFEAQYLSDYTPCHGFDTAALIDAIAVTHVEFVLVHPFREGNGRLARLLADVMAVQAGRDPLDYSGWEADRADYYSAIQHGMDGNYEPMRLLVIQALGAQSL